MPQDSETLGTEHFVSLAWASTWRDIRDGVICLIGQGLEQFLGRREGRRLGRRLGRRQVSRQDWREGRRLGHRQASRLDRHLVGDLYLGLAQRVSSVRFSSSP